jgi:hypothetical protein
VLAEKYRAQDALHQLEDRVREHAAWLETNGSTQLATYINFVAVRGDSGASQAPQHSGQGDGEEGAGNSSNADAQMALNAFAGQKPQSVVILAELDTKDVTGELEQRVKDVVCAPSSRGLPPQDAFMQIRRFCSKQGYAEMGANVPYR